MLDPAGDGPMLPEHPAPATERHPGAAAAVQEQAEAVQ